MKTEGDQSLNMKLFICLIIFHSVFGKNFLVEVENDPTRKELSSDEKFEAELNNSLKDTSLEEEKKGFEKTKKTGTDYNHLPSSIELPE